MLIFVKRAKRRKEYVSKIIQRGTKASKNSSPESEAAFPSVSRSGTAQQTFEEYLLGKKTFKQTAEICALLSFHLRYEHCCVQFPSSTMDPRCASFHVRHYTFMLSLRSDYPNTCWDCFDDDNCLNERRFNVAYSHFS